ncbi:MAG TPA: hypothetical protein VHU87_06930 [Rhizomicrobium sp.]|jgi:hypothetical protein|nr:hypothetical protein [Rhizomicrobium sp.]
MRSALWAGILILAATAAAAKPPLAPEAAPFQLKLPSEDRMAATYAPHAGQSDFAAIRSDTSQPPSGNLSLGPIHAEAVTDCEPGIRSGRHRTVMQYRLDGVHMFGGNVGGSLGGRAAVLSLHWPSGE